MIKSLRLAASALVLTAAMAGVAAAQAPTKAPTKADVFTAKDMASLDRLSDPRVSPDGRHVLYSVRTMDYPANKASMSLWVADLKTKMAPRRLKVSDGGAASGRWSADGKTIYFTSSRAGGTEQVFKTDVTGETATQVTATPFDVQAYKVAADGKTIVVAMAVFPDCPDLACTEARLAAKGATKATGVVFDRLFVRHWDTWSDGTRNHLFAYGLDASGVVQGHPVALMKGFDGDSPTKPFGGDEDFTITPDNKVAFSAKVAGKDEAWTTNFDIWSRPLDGSDKLQNLTAANTAWDTAPVFSPDGKWAAYRAMKRPGFEADRFGIMLREVATGQERELAPSWDRSADAIAWSRDGKSIYATALDVGQGKLFAIDVKTGKVSALTGEGHVTAFDVGPSGIVFASDSLKSPSELFLLPAKGPAVKVASVSSEALKDVAWGEPEQFSFKGWNDETVHGFLVKPANFDPAKKYPVAFLIHGGPQGSFSNAWSYRWNPQVYANAGYAVVMIDFHGSTGYGQAFTDSISRHWGDRPLEDLQKGWSFVLSKYGFLDGDRACALGASYGGYMVNWIAGNWNEPWKCLVNHDGVFDTRAMGYSTEELWFTEWENGGTPWQAGTTYETFNPALHVDKWVKPQLVVQGQLDYRIPVEQGLATFTALQRRGVPSKLLYFPNENHWVLKAQNSVQWHKEVLDWLDQWTGNTRPGK
ncbi:alpha/beta hydrolase family protein [Caulobacter vibrioides]|nr:S9 family peptidase [Caulobacter vibrioides]YP_002517438.1 acylamino-acid-releasing enzyme [Caulobacter vibrioides NA1000]ACL95530.1 acylamino-acid-releasing enzyme [Caulobacter vibrioides NA1000]ATC28859.1 S9 family peptidase [Caulobacter vibrioides]QXZ50371.1 S9 family peptidase [Caulobacter vibrioides]